MKANINLQIYDTLGFFFYQKTYCLVFLKVQRWKFAKESE